MSVPNRPAPGVSPYPATSTFGNAPKPKPKPKAPPVKTGRAGQVLSPVPPNPVSKAIDATGKPSVGSKPISGLPVKQQQIRLKNAGFNVTVDGIEGPQTAMARKAFINGVAPGYWNKVWLKNHPPAASPSGKVPPASSGSSGTGTGSGSTGSTPRDTTGSGAGTTPTSPATTVPPIDPSAYANNAANAEFNPQITDANFNLALAQGQLPESLKDLSGWNKQVTNTFNNYDAGAAYQPGIDAAQASAQNVSHLFGDSTAPDSLAANDPNVAMLQGLQGTQNGFQDIMQSVLAAQGRDYARRATREGNVNISKAQTDLKSLIAQKGQARSKYFTDQQNTAISQAQAQQALDQAKALAPGQQALQAAQVKVAQTEANNAPAIAQAKLKQANAATKAAVAQATAAAAAASGKINWNDVRIIDQAASGAVTGAVGPKGGLVLRPDLALQNVLTAAQGAGAPPSVVTAGIAKILRALNISHGKGQWSRWKWNGKSFVLGPAPKKK